MDVIELPNTLLGWMGVLTALSLAGVFIFHQVRRSELSLLRESINDLTKRVEYLEHENNRYKEENAQLKTDYNSIKFKKDYLKSIVIQALANKAAVDEAMSKEITEMLKNK